MFDITKCLGTGCDLKERCYRFKAQPNLVRQSYIDKVNSSPGDCEYFWESPQKITPTTKED